jgi:hypothetical protein
MNMQLETDLARSARRKIEGSTNIDGRGPSVWDDMAARKNSDGTLKIIDGSSGEPATDSYNRYREDVALLRSFGVNCHVSQGRLLHSTITDHIDMLTCSASRYRGLVSFPLEDRET